MQRKTSDVSKNVNFDLFAALAIALIFFVYQMSFSPLIASWVFDEPRIVLEAYQANAKGILGQQIAQGSLGFTYGSVSIWIYQLLFKIGTKLENILYIKFIFSYLGCAAGLFFCLRKLRLNPLWAPTFLSLPIANHYFRIPWDNVWLLPLSSFILVALFSSSYYVAFGIAVLCCWIHPVSFFYIAPFLILKNQKRLLSAYRSLKAHPQFKVAFVTFVLLAWSLGAFWLTNMDPDLWSKAYSKMHFSLKNGLHILEVPAYLSFLNFEHFIPEIKEHWPWIKILWGIHIFLFLFTLFKMSLKTKIALGDFPDWVKSIFWGLAAVSVFFVMAGIPGGQHHMNFCIIGAFLSWALGTERSLSKTSLRSLLLTFITVQSLSVVGMNASISRLGGSRSLNIGLSLENQVNAVNVYCKQKPRVTDGNKTIYAINVPQWGHIVSIGIDSLINILCPLHMESESVTKTGDKMTIFTQELLPAAFWIQAQEAVVEETPKL